MRGTRLIRLFGMASVVFAAPLVAVLAQTQPSPPTPQSPPAATKPETSQPPASSPPSASTTTVEKKASAPASIANLVGLSAKSSDGHNLGTVQNVMDASGKSGVGVKVGGFLGLGGHFVQLPDGKFNRVGDTVQVTMTADEVNKLPQAVQK